MLADFSLPCYPRPRPPRLSCPLMSCFSLFSSSFSLACLPVLLRAFLCWCAVCFSSVRHRSLRPSVRSSFCSPFVLLSLFPSLCPSAVVSAFPSIPVPVFLCFGRPLCSSSRRCFLPVFPSVFLFFCLSFRPLSVGVSAHPSSRWCFRRPFRLPCRRLVPSLCPTPVLMARRLS